MNASWGISGDGKTAFIEMAAASGLELVPAEKRDPLVTTSRGTGELILQALESGATNIIIGIGGSATNDGGAGMVQALGAKLCDANGNEIGFGGPTMNDRFYAFSWNEVQWQINDWKNENWGLRGYILSEPEANTQPIYEMYSPLLNDRFYVWSWEEVQMQISKWENEYWGHRGYVFSK